MTMAGTPPKTVIRSRSMSSRARSGSKWCIITSLPPAAVLVTSSGVAAGGVEERAPTAGWRSGRPATAAVWARLRRMPPTVATKNRFIRLEHAVAVGARPPPWAGRWCPRCRRWWRRRRGRWPPRAGWRRRPASPTSSAKGITGSGSAPPGRGRPPTAGRRPPVSGSCSSQRHDQRPRGRGPRPGGGRCAARRSSSTKATRRARVGQPVGELLAGPPGVEGHGHRPDGDRGPEGHDPLGQVAHGDGHPVARPDPEPVDERARPSAATVRKCSAKVTRSSS